VLPSGYLIRPCDGGGSMIYIVDHVDLNVSSSGSFILMNVHLASLLRYASIHFLFS
jgi:hypothetical protein